MQSFFPFHVVAHTPHTTSLQAKGWNY